MKTNTIEEAILRANKARMFLEERTKNYINDQLKAAAQKDYQGFRDEFRSPPRKGNL